MYYAHDTVVGRADAWTNGAPDVLVIEVTSPDSWRDSAKHLAPADLEQELLAYRQIKGSLPAVLVIHMVPWLEDEIRREVDEVAQRLGIEIGVAFEDMVIDL